MKKIIFTLVSVLTTALNAGAQTTLFSSHSSSGASKAYYRIPAILTDTDGTLWAFTDDRTGVTDAKAWGDIGSVGTISIIAKKITKDKDATDASNWSEAITIAEGKGTTNTSCETYEMAHGDASVVCDRESGDILMMCASGNTRFGESSSDSPLRVAKYYYDASEGTWSHSEVTSQIYNLSSASGIFFTSGKMCQSRLIKKGSHYRIYASLTTLDMVNQVIYSDDFGSTWNVLSGGSTLSPTDDDEAKLVELPNGNVLYSARMEGGRYFNIYTYSDDNYTSGSWGSYALSNSTNGGTAAQNNSTNGDILVVPALENGDVTKPVYIALQSIPYGAEGTQNSENVVKRCNVSIYWKLLSTKEDFDSPSDFTSGWTRVSVTTGKSAYSALAVTNDKNIAILYEDAGERIEVGTDHYMEIYDIIFRKYALEDIATTESAAKAMTRAAGTYYSYSTLSEDEHWSTFAGESSGDSGNDDVDKTSIDYWLGKVFTLKSLLTYPIGSDNYGTTVQRYIHSTYDSDGKLQLEAKKVEEVSSFDYTYYWTLSKDPDGEYYYLSCLNGDSYMGQEAGVSKKGDIVSYGNATCTDNYKTEFQVLDFVTSWGFDSDHVLAAKTLSSGVAFKFYVQYSGENKELRVLSLNENGKFGWTKHTQTGELDGSPETYFSTEFILTEVTAGNINEYGTIESPTHYGFPVKMTRSDDGKADVDIEGYYYYGTLKLPFAVDLTSAVDAAGNKYDLSVFNCTGPTNVDGKKVGLTEITTLTDNTLPRETPVLLRMGRKDKADYPATQITLYLQPALAQNIEETGFKGTLGKKSFTNDEYNPTTNANFFILGKKATDGRVKFYYLNDQVLAANKAYYVYDGSTSAKTLTFSFQDSPSAIGMPEADDEDDMTAPVFDLAGRRITGKASKGVYIRNGKKFVVR